MNKMMDLYVKCAQALGYSDGSSPGSHGVVNCYYIKRVYPNSPECNHLALMDVVTIDGKRSSSLRTWMLNCPNDVFKEMIDFLKENTQIDEDKFGTFYAVLLDLMDHRDA